MSRALGTIALLLAASAAQAATAQAGAATNDAAAEPRSATFATDSLGGLHGAVETARVAADPAALVAGLGNQRPEWLLWTVPAVGEARDACCFGRSFHRRECSLAKESQSWGTSSEFRGGGPNELDLLLQVVRGEPARLLLVGASCPVDGAGRAVTVLEGVDPVKSLDFVERLARAGDGDDELGARALAAIGYHAGDEAGRRLERLTFDKSLGLELRKNALFWAAQTRPDLAVRLAERVFAEESNSEMREHALFVLSQAETPEARERLRRAATSDADPELRSKALFWLSQLDEEKDAASWIYQAVVAERDSDVREQGVFALSQVENDGVLYLLRLLRESEHSEVKRQALFWLGQSDDPRALDELSRLLEN